MVGQSRVRLRTLCRCLSRYLYGHFRRHHVARKAAQRQQGDHEGEEKNTHRLMIGQSAKKFPSLRFGTAIQGLNQSVNQTTISSIHAAIATMPTSSMIVTVLIGSLNTVPRQAH